MKFSVANFLGGINYFYVKILSLNIININYFTYLIFNFKGTKWVSSC
ncbi:hypothetical protein PEPS_10540 [Persicobacter psychrovividus]|uniref:Uncharacterized protein n=1 Tax=Persicobacter psychrovividus TaxID=387638 RepID=A0ABN6L6Q3_9BACT|nr:hypothetical protein PEPS_10540 [Persicobacter psychrovividus]